MFSALDAVETALILVDDGRTDTDAVTTADVFSAAQLAGTTMPDRNGVFAVRTALDVLADAPMDTDE